MSAAKRFLPHYTFEDYARWEGDWESWDRVAMSTSPGPVGRRQRVAASLIYSLQRSIEQEKCSAELVLRLDWIIRNDTVVRPDVLVLCEGIPDCHLETTQAMVHGWQPLSKDLSDIEWHGLSERRAAGLPCAQQNIAPAVAEIAAALLER